MNVTSRKVTFNVAKLPTITYNNSFSCIHEDVCSSLDNSNNIQVDHMSINVSTARATGGSLDYIV